jgi:hypothetical protein
MAWNRNFYRILNLARDEGVLTYCFVFVDIVAVVLSNKNKETAACIHASAEETNTKDLS